MGDNFLGWLLVSLNDKEGKIKEELYSVKGYTKTNQFQLDQRWDEGLLNN